MLYLNVLLLQACGADELALPLLGIIAGPLLVWFFLWGMSGIVGDVDCGCVLVYFLVAIGLTIWGIFGIFGLVHCVFVGPIGSEPDLTGLTVAEAAEKAADTRRTLTISEVKSSSQPPSTIVSQGRIGAMANEEYLGRDVGREHRNTVEVQISGGEGRVTVPEVTGLTEPQACKALIEAGLTPKVQGELSCLLPISQSGKINAPTNGPEVKHVDVPAGETRRAGTEVHMKRYAPW